MRALGAAVAAAFVFGVLSGMVWHARGPMHWEFRFISLARRIPPPAAMTWQDLFEPMPFAIMTLVIAAVALAGRRPRLALSGAAGCFIAVVAAEHVFKPIIDSRQALHHYRWYHPELGTLTFPSGHVTAAAAVATFAWLVLRRHTALALVVFAVPAVVGWAMVSLDLHYPIDALGGVILGPLVVCATVAAGNAVFGRGGTPAPATTGAHPSEPSPCGSS